MSMFTLETCGAANFSNFLLLPTLDLGRVSFVELMRYHFESHLTQIFPKHAVLFSLNDAYVCMREGVLL